MTENKNEADGYRAMIEAYADGRAESLRIEIEDQEPLIFWRMIQAILDEFPHIDAKLRYDEDDRGVEFFKK